MTSGLFRHEDLWRFGALVAVWLGVAALLPIAPFPVVWMTFWPPLASAALLLGGWYVYRFLRPDERIATTALVAVQMGLFSLGMELFNYLGFGFRRPSIDASLAAADEAIGFDWAGFVVWLHSVPGADALLTFAYGSSLLQVIVVLLLLGMSGRRAELDRFSLAFIIGASVTTIFWISFPSYGVYAHRVALGLPVPDGLAVTPGYARTLLDLAAGDFRPLRYSEMIGLIAFPSFHTVLAIITMYGAWRLRAVGPLLVALNVVVLIAIPGDGGHYLVDLFGGALVALFAIVAARTVTGPAETGATRAAKLVMPSPPQLGRPLAPQISTPPHRLPE